MSDLIRLRIAATTAARTAETLVEGVPVWDEEEGALYMHDGTTAGGVAVGGTGWAPEYKTQACENDDAVTITWAPNRSGNTLVATLATGSGSFTKPLALSRTVTGGGAVVAGTSFKLLLQVTTSSAGRALEIRENTALGDLLDTWISDTEGPYTAVAEFVFTGSVWIKLWSAIQS